jgi:hypothetical protein
MDGRLQEVASKAGEASNAEGKNELSLVGLLGCDQHAKSADWKGVEVLGKSASRSELAGDSIKPETTKNIIDAGPGSNVTAGNGDIVNSRGAFVTAESGSSVRGYSYVGRFDDDLRRMGNIKAGAGSTVALNWDYTSNKEYDIKQDPNYSKLGKIDEWQVWRVMCTALSGSNVYAYKNSRVDVAVKAGDPGADVHAYPGSAVTVVEGEATVNGAGPTIHSDGGKISVFNVFKEKTHLSAYDGAIVSARQNSLVDAYAGSTIHAYQDGTVIAHPGSIVHQYGGSSVINDGGKVIQHRQ